MKKLPLFALSLIFLVATLASATIELSSATMTLNVDYEQFNDDDLRTIAVDTSSFTIRNPTAQEKNITITAVELPSGYTSETKTVTLPANATSAPITLKVNVPHAQDGGEKTIGALTFTENNQVTRASLVQKTRSMLKLDRLTVNYIDADDNDREDSFNEQDQETYTLDNSIKPGTEVTITFDLENVFSSRYDEDDGNLENVQITMEPNDNDFLNDNFEEDYDVDDIALSESQEVDVTFTVSEDADQDTYSFDITVEAEDGKGASYAIEKTLELEIERQKNDLRITELKISPNTITACDESFTVDAKLKNFGTNDQREAGITVYNQKLGINENLRGLKINDYASSTNTWQKKFTFALKAGTKEGTYPLEVNTYINEDDHVENANVDVVIGRCAAPTPASTTTTATTATTSATGTEGSNTVNPAQATRTITTSTNTASAPSKSSNQNDADDSTRISSAAIINTIEDPYAKEDYLIAALIVAIAAVLALIVIFFIVLLK